MRLAYLELSGFRGFQGAVRVNFGRDVTVIDGRNGVGKSTIFDAIEFALTGGLTKYKDAKSHGDPVDEYVWWRGAGAPAGERFVEVGFSDVVGTIAVRRTPSGVPEKNSLDQLHRRLCDLKASPSASLAQLCVTSLIRDEHITSLSLDMKEADRYALLRQALGADDGETWINRGTAVSSAARQRREQAEKEVTEANSSLATTVARLDELRGSLASDDAVRSAVDELRGFTDLTLPPDQLPAPTRVKIAEVRERLERLKSLAAQLAEVTTASTKREELDNAVSHAERAIAEAESTVAQLPPQGSVDATVSEASALARDLATLVQLGQHIGLLQGQCPLCAQVQSAEQFEQGLASMNARSRNLDEKAAALLQEQRARSQAELALTNARELLQGLRARTSLIDQSLSQCREKWTAMDYGGELTAEAIALQTGILLDRLEAAEHALRVIETLRLNTQLQSAVAEEGAAREILQKAQDTLSRAERAEARAILLSAASKRAVAETLELRLQRVLPLMAELYSRLRPHPVWDEIKYTVRGDIRRFLKLQVGDGLNPQFMFSSGQRRATGLAFLLAVNLSLAWSKWRSILLDDPVQHIDDFRSVHLVEVLAQLVTGGRQVICAVEDSALADLLARRLPLGTEESGRRVSLGTDHTGALAVLEEGPLLPLMSNVLLQTSDLATG